MQTLEHITVVDLSQNLAGPYCTQILGDLGARILKIEPPSGDPARAWGPPFVDGSSTIFLSANRNKEFVTLDLKQERDRCRLDAFIDQADVFVQALRPGAIDRLGYAAETLLGRNPRLIYCTINAYGDGGPLRDQAGYDPLMQAHAGIMSVTGHGNEPARAGTSIVDMGTGMWAAIGILAALRERDATGKGTHITASLYDTALAWSAYHMMGYIASGVVPGPSGTGFPLIAPYDAFPTCDGRLMIAAANDNLFDKLCDALELSELRADTALRTNPQRVAARDRVNAAISDVTLRMTTAVLEEKLRTAGVPCAPVLNMSEVVAHPQTVASGMLQMTPDGYTAVAMPLKFDGTRPFTTTPATPSTSGVVRGPTGSA
jgi:crotonobetainyl-CoA:carnitine CoA-transferase CaiB-like acyl-CoA transferase